MKGMIKVELKDTVSPRLKHKLAIYPRIVHKLFITDSLHIIQQYTHDYVPRNSNPPPEYDEKQFAGQLQSGFYEYPVKADLYESSSDFGYHAYDWVKGHEYAGIVETDASVEHPPRYAGHEPRVRYMKAGLEDTAKGDKLEKMLARRYLNFLKRM